MRRFLGHCEMLSASFAFQCASPEKLFLRFKLRKNMSQKAQFQPHFIAHFCVLTDISVPGESKFPLQNVKISENRRILPRDALDAETLFWTYSRYWIIGVKPDFCANWPVTFLSCSIWPLRVCARTTFEIEFGFPLLFVYFSFSVSRFRPKIHFWRCEFLQFAVLRRWLSRPKIRFILSFSFCVKRIVFSWFGLIQGLVVFFSCTISADAVVIVGLSDNWFSCKSENSGIFQKYVLQYIIMLQNF
ncbi:hypothetical protein SS50377_20669 [Spironucleus salmonicida]|uniref:Uncharacterized protein n=1 Tax=Spironucleus salmonicida TaxID=348837 RepID=V6LZ15_9EUKA|nr:hypothetical protein SS50377_28742 [Spironucleus salmonicida]KAH0577318.1 hypothetical protein SS50377_20669 [Spironucleus salmonicida]|eukprot:EST49518.1 Hypothetical protein SS50377_10121 [Spironucleus salmonicida]